MAKKKTKRRRRQPKSPPNSFQSMVKFIIDHSVFVMATLIILLVCVWIQTRVIPERDRTTAIGAIVTIAYAAQKIETWRLTKKQTGQIADITEQQTQELTEHQNASLDSKLKEWQSWTPNASAGTLSGGTSGADAESEANRRARAEWRTANPKT